jgi:hypothetical protein
MERLISVITCAFMEILGTVMTPTYIKKLITVMTHALLIEGDQNRNRQALTRNPPGIRLPALDIFPSKI